MQSLAVNDMTFDAWLREVAQIIGCEPRDVLEMFYQARSLLYEGGVSPREAADFIRINA